MSFSPPSKENSTKEQSGKLDGQLDVTHVINTRSVASPRGNASKLVPEFATHVEHKTESDTTPSVQEQNTDTKT